MQFLKYFLEADLKPAIETHFNATLWEAVPFSRALKRKFSAIASDLSLRWFSLGLKLPLRDEVSESSRPSELGVIFK